LKRKKTVSKHDIIRALKAILSDIQILAQRVTMMESVLFNYIEMRKDDKKLMKYMEKNVKRIKEETKED
tara:strand:+ start:216 stop:422 length:207 start_codon:yes stop_codon:yes gene_type:complete